MKSRLSAGVRKRNHLSKRLLIIKEEVSWYIMLVTASPELVDYLNVLLPNFVYKTSHILIYLFWYFSCNNHKAAYCETVVFTKKTKKKHDYFCDSYRNLFQPHKKKSHHTLVNIKSHNYEIKGMNYDIQSHNYEI